MNGRDTAQRTLAFLEANGLPCEPDFYRYAWCYVTASDTDIVEEVQECRDLGMRVQLTMVRARFGTQPVGDAASRDAAVDRLMGETLDQTARIAQTTADLRQYLEGDIPSAGTGGAPADPVAGLRERAEKAETELRDAAARIDNLRNRMAEARSTAGRDALTGLADRRGIGRVLTGIDNRRSKGAIAIVDIDHFKALHDLYGDDVGDRAIRLVGDVLVEHVAPATVARWDGGEFLVVHEGGDEGELADAIDRARQALAARRVKLSDGDPQPEPVSFSAGTAVIDGSTSVAIRAANVALHRATAAGGGRTLCDASSRARRREPAGVEPARGA